MLPDADRFPYVIRVVSEITESNGSSSIASVCGASLARWMQACPWKYLSLVLRWAVKEGDRFAVLSDILGDEDHLGDMDFKVAGSKDGITALQMDIKIEGITPDIMEQALKQAHAGRIHILEAMNKVLASAVLKSMLMPRIMPINIDADKIRDVIGKGGATIRQLTEETGAGIDIEDNGTIRILAKTKLLKRSHRRIESLTAEVEGQSVWGYGCSGRWLWSVCDSITNTDGLVHISQITDERVENVSDHLSEGQTVKVLVQDVDNRGRIKLTMKGIDQA